MTTPLPDGAHDPARPASGPRERNKISRKWAYLLCTTTYVPLMHADLEQPLREAVDELFTALPGEGLDVAERTGARLVALNCVDRSSLRITLDVLTGPLVAACGSLERVTRLLGALAAGYAEALRQHTMEQQESMIRAVKEVAMKAARVAEAHREERDDMATELTLLRRQLSHQLLHDALTGLPNRQFFTTRLEEVLNSGSPTTLYRLELNGFSAVNDGLGTARTDAVLVAVATRLRSAAAGAMVARLDRASFAILEEHPPEVTRSPLPPADLVARLTEALSEATYVDDMGVALTANIGVVQSPPHGTAPIEFLQAADVALRLAKEQGPGRWRLLTPEESAADRRLLRLTAIMPGAMETGGLAVGYRLRVNLSNEQPVAVDAYPRWEEAGLSGQACVALAEQTGLSPQVGQWLLREATKKATRTDLPLSISLSPDQAAAPDLVDTVLDTLTDASLPPTRLHLAMPAKEIFDGRPQTLDNLTTLAKAGVETAVHNFRGDPSEVVRLPDLPLHTVSLSPRLVAQARTVGQKPLLANTFKTLTALIHETGAKISVEDLRTPPEKEWWLTTGADTATGPLFPAHQP